MFVAFMFCFMFAGFYLVDLYDVSERGRSLYGNLRNPVFALSTKFPSNEMVNGLALRNRI